MFNKGYYFGRSLSICIETPHSISTVWVLHINKNNPIRNNLIKIQYI